jgi:hypothetical protein
MTTPDNKDKKDELWKRSFFLLGDQFEKDLLWKNYSNDQLAEVFGRLYLFYANKILQSDEGVTYPTDFNKKIVAHVGETLGAGFFIYCSNMVDIKKEYDSYFEVKPHPNDPGLKDFLMGEVEKLIDGQEVDDKYQPEPYVFETLKDWARTWIVKIIPNDTTFAALESEVQKEVYLTQIAWLLTLGYIVTSLYKTYYEAKPKSEAKVKKPSRRLVQ